MRLVDKYYPGKQKHHKLFKCNNVKQSYNCFPSVKNVIQIHNSEIMKDPKPSTCGCPPKPDCLFKESDLAECLVQNAFVNQSTAKKLLTNL